jgi:hypothetical protein
MECIIKIVDGVPIDHPILLDNFISAYPDIDLNNLPAQWAKFERLAEPEEILPGETPYHKREQTYTFDESINKWKDTWNVVEMNAEEKAIKRAEGDAIVEEYRQGMLQYGEEKIAQVEERFKPVWQTWIDQMKAYTYDDPWPLQNLKWPRQPPAVIIQYPDPE